MGWRDRLNEGRWSSYQGDRAHLGVSWTTDTEAQWTLYDTASDGMVIEHHDRGEDWVPNGTVWLVDSDDMDRKDW